MFELDSKYGQVKIYAETIEEEAVSQIVGIANSPLGENAHIRIMPDAHAGKGCVIGTTMRYEGKVCPNIVGVDIGCGVLAVPFIGEIDLEKFDEACHKVLVSGRNAREEALLVEWQEELFEEELRRHSSLRNLDWIYKSLGTLGGGNHFVELNKGENYNWLVIHTGSRNLGKQVAEYYQNLASNSVKDDYKERASAIIAELKAQGKQHLIQEELAKLERKPATGLEFLTGAAAADYLNDMAACQEWAEMNRNLIAKELISAMGWEIVWGEYIESVHNYIDLEHKIIRKGAIQAYEGQKCIIPLNMRDGSLICVGKGNENWNCSAPHGAGRIMSRAKAKASVSLEDFQQSMEGIYSSTVCEGTIDESPFAYKDMTEIINAISPTVEIVERIIPIYNFKATE